MPDSAGHCPIYEASLIQILAHPDRFDGKRVRLSGYIHVEFESNGIYLHKDDADHGLHGNALWVASIKPGAVVSSECHNTYVVLEGTFTARDHGHMGLWTGAIRDITRCDPLP
jgi:hypothetical protein